jgi:hypothetical protein
MHAPNRSLWSRLCIERVLNRDTGSGTNLLATVLAGGVIDKTGLADILKLDSQRGPGDFLVIDHLEEPCLNSRGRANPGRRSLVYTLECSRLRLPT